MNGIINLVHDTSREELLRLASYNKLDTKTHTSKHFALARSPVYRPNWISRSLCGMNQRINCVRFGSLLFKLHPGYKHELKKKKNQPGKKTAHYVNKPSDVDN